MKSDLNLAMTVFGLAAGYASKAGLSCEIEWQRRVSISEVSESQFLRECAWVVLCSGFREATVRKHFNYISLCYCDWESAHAIQENDEICLKTALVVFANKAKLQALIEIARRIADIGFTPFWNRIQRDPYIELQKLPFIGPVTSRHLYKNLGGNIDKPDRHLVRIAKSCGYPNSKEFCEAIAHATREAVNVVDLIIWRYLADNPRVRGDLFLRA